MTKAELIDALDKDGSPIGERKTRLQILDDGDWRNVVHVWVVNNEAQLLVQQRAHKGLWDDLWDVSVGGGVSAGEEPIHTAARELDEELGIKVQEQELEVLGRWETTKPLPERGQTAHEFSHTFLLHRDIPLSALVLQPKEVVQVKWLPLDDFQALITDDIEYKKWVPHPKGYYLGVIAAINEMSNK